MRARSGDQRKRPPSQSPEPGRPQKHPKPEQSTGSATSDKGAGSRQPSFSNGSADPRRPSTQLNADLRREADKGSLAIGSISGNSTPHHMNGTSLSRKEQGNATVAESILETLQGFSSSVAAQASLQIARQHAHQAQQRANAEYEEQRGKFERFPALKEKKYQARARTTETLQKAERNIEEHMSGQSRIMEILASLIGSAVSARSEEEKRADLASRDDLEAHKESMIKQYTLLSTALSDTQGRLRVCENQAGEAKRTADGAAGYASDSRKEFKEVLTSVAGVQKDAAEAKKDVQTTKSQLAATSKSLDDAKANASQALNLAKDAKHAADNISVSTDEVKSLSNRLSSVQGQLTAIKLNAKHDANAQSREDAASSLDLAAIRKELTALKAESSTQYASKKDVVELESQLETAVQFVAGVHKANAATAKEVEHIKSNQGPPKKADVADAAYKSRVDQLLEHQIWTEVPKLAESVGRLEQKVLKVQKLTTGEQNTAIETMQEFGSLLGWMDSHEKELEQVRNKLLPFMDSVDEPGKGTVKERFKKLDRAVNNLSTLVGGDGKTTIPQRVTTVEKRLDDLKHSIESVKTSSTILGSQSSLEEGEILSQQVEPSNEMQQDKLVARVPELEQKYHALRREIDEVKSTVNINSPPSHLVDDSSLGSRMRQLERKFQDFQEEQEGKDNVLTDHIDATGDELRVMQSQAQQHINEGLSRMTNTLTEASTRLEHLEKSMQSKFSRADVDQSLKATIQPLRDGAIKMQNQIMQIQAQKNRQASMPAPQAPPVWGQASRMPNGVRSPQMDAPQRVPTPQALPSQDLARMQSQIDAIIIVQQQLKGRCDNLVTDEVVKAMAIQMSEMYPEAKNCTNAHKALAKRTDALEGEVRGLQTATANATNKLGEYVALRAQLDNLAREQSEVGKQARTMELDIAKLVEERKEVDERGKKMARELSSFKVVQQEVGTHGQRMDQEIAALKTTTATLSKAKPPSPTTPAIPAAAGVSTKDFTALKDQVNDLGKLAKATDILSRGHGSRFSNLGLNTKKMTELDAMADEVKKHAGRIDSLEWKHAKVETGMQELGGEVAKALASVEFVEERVKAL